MNAVNRITSNAFSALVTKAARGSFAPSSLPSVSLVPVATAYTQPTHGPPAAYMADHPPYVTTPSSRGDASVAGKTAASTAWETYLALGVPGLQLLKVSQNEATLATRPRQRTARHQALGDCHRTASGEIGHYFGISAAAARSAERRSGSPLLNRCPVKGRSFFYSTERLRRLGLRTTANPAEHRWNPPNRY